MDANFAEAHYQLGVPLDQHNRTDEAMEELKGAGLLASDRNRASVWHAGKKEEAKQELDTLRMNAKAHRPRVP